MDVRIPLGSLVFLVAAVVLALLGFGGEAGNGAGLLFWMLLPVLGLILGSTIRRGGEEDVARSMNRRMKDRVTR